MCASVLRKPAEALKHFCFFRFPLSKATLRISMSWISTCWISIHTCVVGGCLKNLAPARSSLKGDEQLENGQTGRVPVRKTDLRNPRPPASSGCGHPPSKQNKMKIFQHEKGGSLSTSQIQNACLKPGMNSVHVLTSDRVRSDGQHAPCGHGTPFTFHSPMERLPIPSRNPGDGPT